MTYETIRTDLSDGILQITLDRPEQMNAFTIRMSEELIHALGEANANDAVRAIVFTGSGKAFCAGMDLGSGGDTFDSTSQRSIDDHRDEGGMVSLAIYESTKPVIGALNGHAVGVGITMTLPMDIRVLSDRAKVGFVFARRGINAEACSSWFLPRIVGVSKALEWAMSGRILTPAEALDAGLVSYVVPPE
ncbi:MAG: enoyl-CoA hydratase/isomerase family protein [Myxococcales bacterium]|nr:enoyl-CoA hydratase/isomerase family protein [Myxococcales bacterium]